MVTWFKFLDSNPDPKYICSYGLCRVVYGSWPTLLLPKSVLYSNLNWNNKGTFNIAV